MSISWRNTNIFQRGVYFNHKAPRRRQSFSSTAHEANIKKSCQRISNSNHREKSINEEEFSARKTNFEMRVFIAFCVLISSVNTVACMSDEGNNRNHEEFRRLDSPASDVSSPHDKHATNMNRVSRRNSFLPPQSPSNYFRDLISRNEGPNDNTLEYTIDPSFTSFLLQKQRKQQSEIHGSIPYRMTREVQVKQGRITGIVREMNVQSRLKNVDQFLGIPYAEAPVGSRRFMPPSSPLPWTELKRAHKMEAVCPQKLPNLSDPSGYNKGRYDQIKRLLPYLKRESEDCLYLNLYVTSYGKLWAGMFDKLCYSHAFFSKNLQRFHRSQPEAIF